MRGSSSSTASQPTTEPEWQVGPGRVIGIDPGQPTGITLIDHGSLVYRQNSEPVPYEQRWQFWVRTRERMRQRRQEQAEQRAREDLDISRWLAEKAPTPLELFAQEAIDGTLAWAEGELSVFELLASGKEAVSPTLISSARRTPTRDEVIEKILANTVEVEPELTVGDMIVAHRNGATALERPMVPVFSEEDPVWQELTEVLWDPANERGPRERDWVRLHHKRNQPKNESRAQRKGKR